MNFFSAYDQGFVRVAACTPRCEVADPAFNAEQVIALARDGHARSVGLMVFPELCISSYTLDDLLGQAALHEAVDMALARVVEESRTLSPVLLVGAPIPLPEVKKILDDLGFQVTPGADAHTLDVATPTFRPDIGGDRDGIRADA